MIMLLLLRILVSLGFLLKLGLTLLGLSLKGNQQLTTWSLSNGNMPYIERNSVLTIGPTYIPR